MSHEMIYRNLYRFELCQSDDDVKTDLELTCIECGAHLCDAQDGDALSVLAKMATEHECVTETCAHCHRGIILDQSGGVWIDPEASGEDSLWRETCDAHDTPTAEHEPDREVSR